MLDLSIQSVSSNKQLQTFLCGQQVRVTEKIDGTKLSIIRNDHPFDDDYRKCWIIAYKENVLYSEDFAGLEGRQTEIQRESIGISQYALVHEHLKRVHSQTRDVKLNVEILVELAQRKPTVTRDYEKHGEMFFIGASHVEWFLKNFHVHSIPTDMLSEHDGLALARLLNLRELPTLFEGVLLGNPDALREKFLKTESVLGGQIEGIVIQNSKGERVKIVAKDQYDKSKRFLKKSRYVSSEENEKTYWESIKNIASQLIDTSLKDSHDSFRQKLLDLSCAVYSRDWSLFSVRNDKKTLLNHQDDLYLTSKLILERRLYHTSTDKSVGFFPLAGKPLHRGHWRMIETAAENCGHLYVIVSTQDRHDENFTILGRDMMFCWQRFWMTSLPRNVTLIFSKNSPITETVQQIKSRLNTEHGKCKIFTGADDLENRRAAFSRIEDQIEIVFFERFFDDLSGSQMRTWLRENNKELFIKNLPPTTTKTAELVWKRLKNAK